MMLSKNRLFCLSILFLILVVPNSYAFTVNLNNVTGFISDTNPTYSFNFTDDVSSTATCDLLINDTSYYSLYSGILTNLDYIDNGTVDEIYYKSPYIYVYEYSEVSGTGGVYAYSFDGTDLTQAGFNSLDYNAEGIYADNNYIYVCSNVAGTWALTFNGTDFTQVGYVGASCLDVYADGTYIYIANSNIRAYTFNGTDFTLAGNTTPIGDVVRSIHSDGTYIYAALNNAGLYAYTFNGTDFTTIDHIDDGPVGASYRAVDVYADGTYIYIANLLQSIRAYTFNGTDFTLAGYADDDYLTYGIYPFGDYIYLANYDAGIREYTFNGTDFNSVYTIDNGGEAYSIIGDGTYIYLANGFSGVYAYSVASLTNNTDTTITSNTSISDGNYSVYINCSNSTNTYSSSTIYTYIDTTYPIFSSPSRSPDPSTNATDVNFTITITETNLDTILIEVKNATDTINYTVSGCTSGNPCTFTLYEENYTASDNITYTWYANDSAGNLNNSVSYNYTISDGNIYVYKNDDSATDSFVVDDNDITTHTYYLNTSASLTHCNLSFSNRTSGTSLSSYASFNSSDFSITSGVSKYFTMTLSSVPASGTTYYQNINATCAEGVTALFNVDVSSSIAVTETGGGGGISAICGNGLCELGENYINCPEDCLYEGDINITLDTSPRYFTVSALAGQKWCGDLAIKNPNEKDLVLGIGISCTSDESCEWAKFYINDTEYNYDERGELSIIAGNEEDPTIETIETCIFIPDNISSGKFRYDLDINYISLEKLVPVNINIPSGTFSKIGVFLVGIISSIINILTYNIIFERELLGVGSIHVYYIVILISIVVFSYIVFRASRRIGNE